MSERAHRFDEPGGAAAALERQDARAFSGWPRRCSSEGAPGCTRTRKELAHEGIYIPQHRDLRGDLRLVVQRWRAERDAADPVPRGRRRVRRSPAGRRIQRRGADHFPGHDKRRAGGDDDRRSGAGSRLLRDAKFLHRWLPRPEVLDDRRQTIQNRFSIGPRLGYNLGLSDFVSIWPKIGISYARTSTTTSTLVPDAGQTSTTTVKRTTTGSGVALNLFAPLLFHPAEHFFAGLGPFLDTDLSGDNRTTVWGLKLTIGGWL
jgi:hypothetical protein